MKPKKYLIVEYIGQYPIGKSIILTTRHKNFLKMLQTLKSIFNETIDKGK